MRVTLACLSVVLGGLTPAWASTHYRVVDRPAEDVYYGRVSACAADGGAPAAEVRRHEADAEPAVVNVPLTPGDVLRTPAGERCEAEFDTGTVVRLDGATTLAIETVLAPSLSTRGKL